MFADGVPKRKSHNKKYSQIFVKQKNNCVKGTHNAEVGKYKIKKINKIRKQFTQISQRKGWASTPQHLYKLRERKQKSTQQISIKNRWMVLGFSFLHIIFFVKKMPGVVF